MELEMLPEKQENLEAAPAKTPTPAVDAPLLENGVLFDIDNEETYPPEYTFVVINLLPNVPVYFDREQKTWWTATVSKGIKIYVAIMICTTVKVTQRYFGSQ